MTGAERGFLLLTSHLGVPQRKPLTVAQFRELTRLMDGRACPASEGNLVPADLIRLGCSKAAAERITALLEQEYLLDRYLQRAAAKGCVPVTRVSTAYPLLLRRRLGLDSPGCLWARGDLSLLERPAVSLVGSRELLEPNRSFAAEVGRQAALQDYVLVSGNARGADRTAQDACLSSGGRVISVLADELTRHEPGSNMLFLSEDGFDDEFSTPRALSRNRVIHALGLKTFVAQSAYGIGGTWDGTCRNLRGGWSPVYAFSDGSAGMDTLGRMGANLIDIPMLQSFYDLPSEELSFFDK